MLAKVRIAPVERWCAGSICDIEEGDLGTRIQNLTAPIDTLSMSQSTFCDGRVWRLNHEWINRTRNEFGLAPTQIPRWACEHMLEMD